MIMMDCCWIAHRAERLGTDRCGSRDLSHRSTSFEARSPRNFDLVLFPRSSPSLLLLSDFSPPPPSIMVSKACSLISLPYPPNSSSCTALGNMYLGLHQASDVALGVGQDLPFHFTILSHLISSRTLINILCLECGRGLMVWKGMSVLYSRHVQC